MKNERLWHIRNRISEHLGHNTIEVYKYRLTEWQSLERISLVKYLLKELVDGKIFYSDGSDGSFSHCYGKIATLYL